MRTSLLGDVIKAGKKEEVEEKEEEEKGINDVTHEI